MSRKPHIVQYVDAARACDLSGTTRPMLDYLCREGLLRPSGSGPGKRGKKRLYSFGDIIVLRIIGRLLASGIEIKRLRKGLKYLKRQTSLVEPGHFPFRYVVTDGEDVFLRGPDGTFESLSKERQLAFAFFVDVHQSEAEVLSAAERFGGWATMDSDTQNATSSTTRRK